jgi:glycosyltransferase involved in cell wall biosynthesis
MVNLACGLKAKGHEVELLVYFPELRFFRDEIDAAGIPVHEVTKGKGFSWRVIWRLIRLYHSKQFDGVISFLDGPNFYGEIAQVIAVSRITLIVSERRSFEMEQPSLRLSILRLSHALADKVVANSYAHASWLRKHYWLKRKTYTIYNGYHVDTPRDVRQISTTSNSEPHLLVIGRIDKGKNGFKLLQALHLFHKKHGYCPTLSWAGRQEQDTASLQEREQIEQFLLLHPEISVKWHWLGERRDIPKLLQQCDVLIHVSLHEGLPNAVCEAFIATRPVIASNVCDHPLLVEDGVRGLLCDPLSPESICGAIERFVALPLKERQEMAYNARVFAEQQLTIERMVSEYEALLIGAN